MEKIFNPREYRDKTSKLIDEIYREIYSHVPFTKPDFKLFFTGDSDIIWYIGGKFDCEFRELPLMLQAGVLDYILTLKDMEK